jgi:hypothetical protein
MNIEDDTNFQTVNATFPGIGKKIKVFWGYPEMVQLMHDLQQDTSERPRAGFPADVLMSLHALEAAHDSAFPQLKRKVTNFWNE